MTPDLPKGLTRSFRSLPFHFSLLLLFVLLSSCATLPAHYVKESSKTIRETNSTWLGQRADAMASKHPGKSGFYVLSDGIEALAARLNLASHAQVSIDVQYYYILPDITGKLLFDQLIKAADRGVRVRILLDDIQTKGYERMFEVLSAHPHIQLRLANPFANRKTRGLNFAADFSRLNHRMHNKSITFDNAVTIIGGRNIGTEYFEADNNFNYRDLDVVGLGPVADQVSTEFDTYWNASETIPVTAFVTPDNSAASYQKLKKQLEDALQKAETTPYAAALDNILGDILLSEVSDKLIWAPAQIVYDLPYGESTQNGKSGQKVLAGLLISAVEKAAEEWYLISPYFVPGKTGIQLFAQLRKRGVHCVVVTNSLASTDVSAVYGGYKEYQKPLLELGVEIWEVMAYPDLPANKKGVSTDRQSLHAKTFSIDNKQLFVGSFNWDARSRGINTEMGVLIESRQLAGLLKESISAALPRNAWQLRLNSQGEVEWVDVIKGKEFVYTTPGQSLAAFQCLDQWVGRH